MQKSEGHSRRGRWALGAAMAAGACLHAAGAAAQEREFASVPHHGLEFYASEEAFQALYMRPMDLGDAGETQVNLGFFLNEERDLIGMLDLLVQVNTPPESQWTLQFGPRAYAALMNVEDTDLFSVGFGGRIRWAFNANGGAAISLGGFYAPSILTFGEADNVRDVQLRLETTLRNGLEVFVGYRLFEWVMTTGPVDDPLAARTREVDDGVQLGLRANF